MPKILIERCIVCHNHELELAFRTHDRMYKIPDEYNIHKCITCGLLIINPQPTKLKLAKHYPKTAYYSYKAEIKGLSGLISKFRTYLIKHYYSPTAISKLFTALIKGVPALPRKKPGKSSRILDVGCGSGKTMALLEELGWKTYGLEIDNNAVKIARDRGLKNIKLGDYKKIVNYPNNYFDCIRLYHVFEHLPDPIDCLNLIYKKLKSGGELIIGTPNTDGVVSKFFGRNWYNLDIPRHLFIFSEKNLKSLVKEKGFSRISVAHCSSDGLGRSIIYTINDKFGTNFDTNKFTLLFFILYPLEWIFDYNKRGDIITLSVIK